MSAFIRTRDVTPGDEQKSLDKCSIEVPYLMAINAGLMQAKDGSYWTDRSWHKDLLKHTEYINRLVFLAPIKKGVPPNDYVKVPTDKMRVVGYTNNGGMIHSYLSVPVLFFKLIKEIKRTDIVHTCIAGYPFPIGWLAVPLARMLGKKVVLIVESSFWRIPSGQNPGILRKLQANIWELMNRYCLRQADYAAYPHEQYRQSLPSPRAGGGVLFQASWIEKNQIASVEDVNHMWELRNSSTRTPSFLFAARMVSEKGTRVLFDSIKYIESIDLDINFDFIGVGPELDLFRQLTYTKWGQEHVRILDPIPYGAEFFKFIRGYDAVLSPGLSDEQPRIVYDAYAGGIPSIASNMPGLAACIEDGVTGKLVPAGDAMALADAIILASQNPIMLSSWGRAGRDAAIRFTHDQMHIDRCNELQKLF